MTDATTNFKLLGRDEILATDATPRDPQAELLAVTKLLLDCVETYGPDYMHGMPTSYYLKRGRAAIEAAQ